MFTKKQMTYTAPESILELVKTDLLCDSAGANIEEFNDVTDIEW